LTLGIDFIRRNDAAPASVRVFPPICCLTQAAYIDGVFSRTNWENRIQPEAQMRTPHLHDFVRLSHDMPDRHVYHDDVGVVVNVSFAETTQYEVDFHQAGHDCPVHCVLEANEIEVVEEPLFHLHAGPNSELG
jgi:hypothetical protein